MWYSSEDNENEDDFVFESSYSPRELRTSGLLQNSSSLKEKIVDPTRGVSLFGTVPPPHSLGMEKLTEIAHSTSEIISDLRPDGVVVYDIQDEPSRNGKDRPFPFTLMHDPRIFSHLMSSKIPPSSELIVYRAMIPNQTIDEFNAWFKQTHDEYSVRNMVLVGGSRNPGETLLTIQETAQQLGNYPDILLGGITIPERHRDLQKEHKLLIDKTNSGISFFTSQVVYNADNAILLLQDYDHLCKSTGHVPVRIFFTFAPFGNESTSQFLEWLGVEIPTGTAKRVLSRADLKARIEESKQICIENWKRILDASKRLKLSVPLGLSVESVSKSRMEQKGALDLFRELKKELDDYYRP